MIQVEVSAIAEVLTALVATYAVGFVCGLVVTLFRKLSEKI